MLGGIWGIHQEWTCNTCQWTFLEMSLPALVKPSDECSPRWDLDYKPVLETLGWPILVWDSVCCFKLLSFGVTSFA